MFYTIKPISNSWLATSRQCILQENVAIAMHCNLRPSNAAPVILHFNRDAPRQVWIHSSCLIALLLLIPYIMLWPWPSTMLICSVSVVCGQTLYKIWVKLSNPWRSYCVFTMRLHGVQRMVLWRPFCPSVKCTVTKQKKLVPTFLYHMKDHSSWFSDKNDWWGGGNPLYLNFGPNWPCWSENGDFQLTFAPPHQP